MKICRVLLNNEAVTVFDYDGTKVQVPSIKRKAETVNVIYKDGLYIVVDNNYKEPEPEKPGKNKKKAHVEIANEEIHADIEETVEH